MYKYLTAAVALVMLSFILSSATPTGRSTYLVLKMENIAKLPSHFRMSTTPFPENTPNPPTRLGLNTLNESGSAQFSEKSLRKIFETIPNWNITVVDLREEPHAFLNGMAITWYTEKNWLNAGLTMEEIEEDQQIRLQHLLQKPMVFLYKDKRIPFPVFVRNVSTEKDFVEGMGMSYIRFPARDHIRPTDETVDEFITFTKTLPSDSWLHFHCSAGKGRTTTFMAMYDMMKNASEISMDEILRRQFLLGGVNLLSAPAPNSWKYSHALERAEFIQHFYQYCLDHPSFDKPWSDWIKEQKFD